MLQLLLFVWYRNRSISPHIKSTAKSICCCIENCRHRLHFHWQWMRAKRTRWIQKAFKFIVRRIRSHRKKMFKREKKRGKKAGFSNRGGTGIQYKIVNGISHTILSHHQIDGNDYVLFSQLLGRCAWRERAHVEYMCCDAWSEPFEALLFSFHFIIP